MQKPPASDGQKIRRYLVGWGLSLMAWAMPSLALAAGEADRNGPLRFGSVNSLTGPAQFPESSAAARAYFDAVNASGGIRGRRLELLVEDDKGDPAEARKVASRLVEKSGVLAMVGSASIVDCAGNAELYQRANLISLQGTGVEPECFASSHVVPINTGPYLSLRNALQFARESLKASRICAIVLAVPGTRTAFEDVVRVWSRESGVSLAYLELFEPGADMSAMVKQAAANRCDAVVNSGIEPMVFEWVRGVQKLGVLVNVPTIFLTPAYTERVAAELSEAPLPIYCMAEFEPWSSRSLALTDWRALMQRAKVVPSSFSQGGYVAAQLLVRALRSIEGDITRESVSAALRSVQSMELTMLDKRLSIGTNTRHNPNRSTLPMKLEQGVWRIARAFWVVAP